MGICARHHTPSQVRGTLQLRGSCLQLVAAHCTRRVDWMEGRWELQPLTLGQVLPGCNFPLLGWACGAWYASPQLLPFPVLPVAWSSAARVGGAGAAGCVPKQYPSSCSHNGNSPTWEAVCAGWGQSQCGLPWAGAGRAEYHGGSSRPDAINSWVATGVGWTWPVNHILATPAVVSSGTPALSWWNESLLRRTEG